MRCALLSSPLLLSLFHPFFCWILHCFFFLFLSHFVSVSHAGTSLVRHFSRIVLPTILCKEVQRCCIQSLRFGSLLTSGEFFLTVTVALCVGYTYTAACEANKGLPGSIPSQATFFNLAKTLHKCTWYTYAYAVYALEEQRSNKRTNFQNARSVR